MRVADSHNSTASTDNSFGFVSNLIHDWRDCHYHIRGHPETQQALQCIPDSLIDEIEFLIFIGPIEVNDCRLFFLLPPFCQNIKKM